MAFSWGHGGSLLKEMPCSGNLVLFAFPIQVVLLDAQIIF